MSAWHRRSCSNNVWSNIWCGCVHRSKATFLQGFRSMEPFWCFVKLLFVHVLLTHWLLLPSSWQSQGLVLAALSASDKFWILANKFPICGTCITPKGPNKPLWPPRGWRNVGVRKSDIDNLDSITSTWLRAVKASVEDCIATVDLLWCRCNDFIGYTLC